MRFRVYSTRDNLRIRNALQSLRTAFGGVSFHFSDISLIEPIESNRSLYETVKAWARLVLKDTRSLSTEYIASLPHDGYDGVILFVDKKRAKEDGPLWGQSTQMNGKSYIEVYDQSAYVRLGRNGTYAYSSNRKGSLGEATSHIVRHEVYHAGAAFYGFSDSLHAFIEEGRFEDYQHYFENSVMEKKRVAGNEDARKLYEAAVSCIGIDVTPKDEVSDAVACAASVNAVYRKAFGKAIGGDASTYLMYQSLLTHPDFESKVTPEPGDIVISPTGYGDSKVMPNGHVGIVGKDGIIMSNNSADYRGYKKGEWAKNFTVEEWKSYYSGKGKYPVLFFRRRTHA